MDLLRKTLCLLVLAIVYVDDSVGVQQLGGNPRRTNGRQLVLGIRPETVLIPVPNIVIRQKPASPAIRRTVSGSTNLKQTIIVAKTANLIHPDAFKPSPKSHGMGRGNGNGGVGRRGMNRFSTGNSRSGMGAGNAGGRARGGGAGGRGSFRSTGGASGNGRSFSGGQANNQNRWNSRNNNGALNMGHGNMGSQNGGHFNGLGAPRGNGGGHHFNNGHGGTSNGFNNGNGLSGNGHGNMNRNFFRSNAGGTRGTGNGNNRNQGNGGNRGNAGFNGQFSNNNPIPNGIANAIANIQRTNQRNQLQSRQSGGNAGRPNGKMTISMGSPAGGARIAIDTGHQNGKKEAKILLVPKNAKPVLVKTAGAVKISRIRGSDGLSRFLIDPHPTAPGATNILSKSTNTILAPVTTEEPPEIEVPEVEGPAAAKKPV